MRRLRVVGASIAAAVTLLGVGAGIWFAQRQLRGDEPSPRGEPHVLLGGVLGEVSVSDGEGQSCRGFASLGKATVCVRTWQRPAGFTSGAAVSVSNHSRLAILSTQDSEVFFLGTGAVEVDVPDLAFGGSFAVETPDTHLSSRAAQFEVAVDPAAPQGSTRVTSAPAAFRCSMRAVGMSCRRGDSWPAAAGQDEPVFVDVTLDAPLVDLPFVEPRSLPRSPVSELFQLDSRFTFWYGIEADLGRVAREGARLTRVDLACALGCSSPPRPAPGGAGPRRWEVGSTWRCSRSSSRRRAWW